MKLINKPIVTKQKRHYEDNYYVYARLFSSAIDTDIIPVCSVSASGDKINFQGPGCDNLEVDVITAIKWAQAILEICQTALHEKQTG